MCFSPRQRSLIKMVYRVNETQINQRGGLLEQSDPAPRTQRLTKQEIVTMSNNDFSAERSELPNKGQKGGRCNLSACPCPDKPAYWYNHGSLAYYCATCAHMLNTDSFNRRDAMERYGHLLCTDESPSQGGNK